jgi:hypothetical protein
MASSMVKNICDNWDSIRNKCCSVGTKVGLRMMIAMLAASGMCGWLLWLWMDLAVGFVIGSFSFWTLGRWDNPLFSGLSLSHGTCNTKV